MKNVIFFIAAFSLIACSQHYELCHYNKPGASIETVHRDQNECQDKAMVAAKAGADEAQKADIELQCMQDRGYHPINYLMR